MRTTLTPTKLIGTVVVALALGALLAPTALARPDSWRPLPDAGSVKYGPDAFERAVIAQRSAPVRDYPDAGRSTLSPSLDTPTVSTGKSDGGFDWGLFAMLAALGGIAVLGAGAVIGVRQRTRLA